MLWKSFAWKMVVLGVATSAVALIAVPPALSQKMSGATSSLSTVTSADRMIQVRYPKSLIVCTHRDGENPDVWSPEGCAAEIAVCDNSEHAGSVLLCLAYPPGEVRGSELQAAAFSVSRIDNFNAHECVAKWARGNNSPAHSERINGLKFEAAKTREPANSHVSEQSIYRIFHRGSCYEADMTLTLALDSAFAAEDAPRKLTVGERERIKAMLRQALSGFRFLK